jgi:hypothetical protein
MVCKALVAMKSWMQGCVTLDVSALTELASGTQCAQDILFMMQILASIWLKVKMTMI